MADVRVICERNTGGGASIAGGLFEHTYRGHVLQPFYLIMDEKTTACSASTGLSHWSEEEPHVTGRDVPWTPPGSGVAALEPYRPRRPSPIIPFIPWVAPTLSFVQHPQGYTAVRQDSRL